MRGKIFTPEEANQMLPLIARIADDIVATYASVNDALQTFEAAKAAAELDASREVDVRMADEAVAEALDRFQALVEEVEALGGTVKDYENGGIDFYGDVDGEIVYLCWRRGEARISHFHRLEEGYAARREIPAPSTVA